MSFLLLTLSTFLYHNNTKQELRDSLFFFDQLCIINCCSSFRFQSPYTRILFMYLYFLELILCQTQIVISFVFIYTALPFIRKNIVSCYFYVFSVVLYTYYLYYNFQTLNTIDRNLWHLSQILYILTSLQDLHQPRFDFMTLVGSNGFFNVKKFWLGEPLTIPKSNWVSLIHVTSP